MHNQTQTIIDAHFCIKNPDVLHTPAQHRDIIAGLLEIVNLIPSMPIERCANQPPKMECIAKFENVIVHKSNV